MSLLDETQQKKRGNDGQPSHPTLFPFPGRVGVRILIYAVAKETRAPRACPLAEAGSRSSPAPRLARGNNNKIEISQHNQFKLYSSYLVERLPACIAASSTSYTAESWSSSEAFSGGWTDKCFSRKRDDDDPDSIFYFHRQAAAVVVRFAISDVNNNDISRVP